MAMARLISLSNLPVIVPRGEALVVATRFGAANRLLLVIIPSSILHFAIPNLQFAIQDDPSGDSFRWVVESVELTCGARQAGVGRDVHSAG
jgi:hypothetical protein